MHVLFFPSHIYTSYFFIYSSFDFTYFQLEIAVKHAYLTRLSTVGKWIKVFPPTIPLQGVLQAVTYLYKVPSQGGMAFWCCSCLSSFSLTPPHWSPSLFPFYGFLFVTITSTWAKNKFGGFSFFLSYFSSFESTSASFLIYISQFSVVSDIIFQIHLKWQGCLQLWYW